MLNPPKSIPGYVTVLSPLSTKQLSEQVSPIRKQRDERLQRLYPHCEAIYLVLNHHASQYAVQYQGVLSAPLFFLAKNGRRQHDRGDGWYEHNIQ
jgi:hypothetical protein